jgi:hypothetical protein
MAPDRDLTVDALEEARRILAEHLDRGGPQHASRTIHRLAPLLDGPDLNAALERMKARDGLRVLK